MTNARSVFESHLPEINRLAGSHFKYLDPDAREEAVQNAVVLAYRYWTRLVERGKTAENVFRGAIWWACKQTRQGRQGSGSGKIKPKCVLDYARRRKANVMVQGGVDLNTFIGASASIPDAVAFRLDVPAFLGTLTPKDRKIALTLAIHGTTETARRIGVSPGAISQFRTRFRQKYDAFHSEI
jgi:DNA-directed RNA polymerase specialized sigma24 family protein